MTGTRVSRTWAAGSLAAALLIVTGQAAAALPIVEVRLNNQDVGVSINVDTGKPFSVTVGVDPDDFEAWTALDFGLVAPGDSPSDDDIIDCQPTGDASCDADASECTFQFTAPVEMCGTFDLLFRARANDCGVPGEGGPIFVLPEGMTILDSIPPSDVVCEPFTVELNPIGMGMILPTDIFVNAVDNCTTNPTPTKIEYGPGAHQVGELMMFDCDDAGHHIPVLLTVQDEVGNKAFCITEIWIEDNVHPDVFECPDDEVAGTNDFDGAYDCRADVVTDKFFIFDACGTPPGQPPVSGTCHVVINCPGFSDDADLIVPVTLAENGWAMCDINPRSYPAGECVINWEFIDPSGNSTNDTDDACYSTVEISDDENPMITCPADVTVFLGGQDCEIRRCGADDYEGDHPEECVEIGGLSSGNVADNCTGDSFLLGSATHDAPEIFETGWTDVLWTIYDEAGLSAACIQTIHVLRAEKPVIKCAFDQEALSDPGECGAFVWVEPPAIRDNCVDEDDLILSHVAIFEDGSNGPFRNCVDCNPDTSPGCWDLDGDGSCDLPGGAASGEDVNGDGACTTADCECRCDLDGYDVNNLPDQFGSDAGGCFDGPPSSPFECTSSGNCDEDASGFYPVGTTSLIWTVYNPRTGLRSQCEQHIWVGDGEAPVIAGCDGPDHPVDVVETICFDEFICKTDLIDQILCKDHGHPVITADDNCKDACVIGADGQLVPGDLGWLLTDLEGNEITDQMCLGLGDQWVVFTAKDCATDHDATSGTEVPAPHMSTPCLIRVAVVIGSDCGGGSTTGNSNDNGNDDNTTGGGGGGGGGGSGGSGDDDDDDAPVVISTPAPVPGQPLPPVTQPGAGDPGEDGVDDGTSTPPIGEGDGSRPDAREDMPRPAGQQAPPMPSQLDDNATTDPGVPQSSGGFCGATGGSALTMLLMLTLGRWTFRRRREQ